MNSAKLIIPFIIFIIFILSTLAFKNFHEIFPTMDLKKLPNHPIHCSCHKNELLSEMAAVEFHKGHNKNELSSEMAEVEFHKGHKYLISKEPMGKGGTSLVFHAIYIGNGKKWKMETDAPTKCVAIKVANPYQLKNKNIEPIKNELVKRKNNSLIANELDILSDIFQAHEKNPKLSLTTHNLSFIRKETYADADDFLENFAIVMELGEQNLYEYWQEATAELVQLKQDTHKISETMLLFIMHEISLGLDELHQREYIFIDLKPQNVMIMPNSPNPKELDEENFGRLQIKLTDFGSALKVPEIGKLTLSENDRKNLMGSFFYRAPELYDPTIDEISHWTDIYSLGRLMLMLAVQTPQIKIFWKELDKNFVEKHDNWTQLLYNMLLAANIPPKPKISPSSSSTTSVRSGSDYEIEEVKSDNSEIENEENLIKLYDELKSNYGHLMKIIEQTQARKQRQRPSALEIVLKCSPKLAHLGRSQVEKKLAHQYSKVMRSPLVDRRNDVEKKSKHKSSESNTLFMRSPLVDKRNHDENILANISSMSDRQLIPRAPSMDIASGSNTPRSKL